jgi:hypothetical protein
MATPRRKYPYNFIYRDGKYVKFELTKDDFDKVIEYKIAGRAVVPVSIGFIEITDVVTAVEKKVEEQPKEKPKKEKEDDSFSKLFNLPYMDPDSEDYLKKQLAEIWEGEQ